MSRSIVQGGGQVELTDLELFLDAGNRLSYPGQGSVWFDISGRGNNFTLTNAPTNDGKRFNFNGSNQYATCTNTTCGNFGTGSFAVELVVYLGSTDNIYDAWIVKRSKQTTPGQDGFPGWHDRVGALGGAQFFVQDNNPGGTSNSALNMGYGAAAQTPQTPYHLVFNVEKNGTQATGSVFINGNRVSISGDNFIGTNSVDNAIATQLMRSYGEVAHLSGSIYQVRMYRRTLTIPQIQQNWQAARSLLGI